MLTTQVDPVIDCKKALGMENGEMSDDQITASSHYNENYLPSYGRLNLLGNAWAAKTNDPNQWLQVDFQKPTIITGISTQGQSNVPDNRFVTQYSISFSDDGNNFYDYKAGGKPKVE